MLAAFYTTQTAQTHGTEYCAYYMGRNSIWHGDAKVARSNFQSDADYTSYLRGRKSAAAEERLDVDTEWDD